MKLLITLAIFLSISTAFADNTSKVHFVKPLDKSVVPQTFGVEFAVDGMDVVKAGELRPGTGHHHLIIDGKIVEQGQVIPKDDTHKHFGDGSRLATLTLKPGKHTLTMQFADGTHKALGEEYNSTITIEVK
jgi:hypothetical protein